MNKERLKKLLAEYGQLALYIYLVIFAVVLVGFAMAIQMGVKVESTTGKAGIWGAAWLATKVTQPLRILGTLALTPVVAQFMKRWKKPVPVPPDESKDTAKG
jgi:cytochrome b561